MARNWTDQDYALTDDLYAGALAARRDGRPVARQDFLTACKTATGRTKDGSVAMHLGNLTQARQDLGLPVLPDVAPIAHYPKKLEKFLIARYRAGAA